MAVVPTAQARAYILPVADLERLREAGGVLDDRTTYPTLSILFHSVTSIQQIILFLTTLVAVTVRDVIVMLQGCFLSLLYAFGPIAIVCAVNQRSAQVTRGWLANTFQVAFWSFFLRLVMRVWLTLGPIASSSGVGGS